MTREELEKKVLDLEDVIEVLLEHLHRTNPLTKEDLEYICAVLNGDREAIG
jgi:hypothetical protein